MIKLIKLIPRFFSKYDKQYQITRIKNRLVHVTGFVTTEQIFLLLLSSICKKKTQIVECYLNCKMRQFFFIDTLRFIILFICEMIFFSLIKLTRYQILQLISGLGPEQPWIKLSLLLFTGTLKSMLCLHNDEIISKNLTLEFTFFKYCGLFKTHQIDILIFNQLY